MSSGQQKPLDFSTFVADRWSALWRYAYALTGDRGHAEDVVQHALERCWRRWDSIDPAGAEAYVRVVVARLVVSRWRRRRFREELLDDEADVPGTEQPGNDTLVKDVIWRELGMLPARMRAVLVLRYVEDLSEVQAAARLGCSVGTVKSQTSRALARLRSNPRVAALVSDDPLLQPSPSLAAAFGFRKRDDT